MIRLLALFPVLSLTILIAAWREAPAAANGQLPPIWEITLPSADCESAPLGQNCHISSPALADLNSDGRPDIILATNSGHVVAVTGIGEVLWETDTAPFFGLAPDGQSMASSPAVADLDGDGSPEVVVGTGSLRTDRCYPGGVVVLGADGRLRAGWPRATLDNNIPPANCPDPVYSTPALGDLDDDGDLEIVVGSFDTRVYAWHDDGRPVAGFPPPSKFYLEQGWPNMTENLADTVWSSPALADVDGDGGLDVIIGSDEGMLGRQPDGSEWDCPYPTPWGNEYCGGTLYVWNGRGAPLPGYPKRLLETIQSSPVVADVDFDGEAEVYVGVGSFYHNNSTDRPTDGFNAHGYDARGNELPGWAGGNPTGGTVDAAPAVGDIAGDSALEIIVPAMNGMLYAWHKDGRPVSGFPMTPIDLFGRAGNYDFNKNPLLADYDGDGKMEIFVVTGWSISIVDGDGSMITNTNFPDDQLKPFYYMDGLIMNNPAIGDVDGDGELELVAHNSRLRVWDLPEGAAAADWPMFRRTAGRTASIIDSVLRIEPNPIRRYVAQGQTGTIRFFLTLSVNGTDFRWSATERSDDLSLPVTSGSGSGAQQIAVDLRLRPELGTYALGTIDITVAGTTNTVHNATQSIPVELVVVPRANVLFAPMIADN